MVRINSALKKATSFNPTEKTQNMVVYDMCKKIKENKLTLPLYQRDVSWNLTKCRDLLNYQLFGKAPVSPISINEINNVQAIPQISFIDRELIKNTEIKNAHLSVVDGQQRLTTNFKAFSNDPDFVNLVLDVSKATFRIIEGSPSEAQIPIGILLNQDEQLLEDYLTKRNQISTLYPLLVKVRNKLHSYSYTINIAEDLTEDEQIEWFEKLNNAGSRVTKIQMAFSKLKLHDLDIYTDYTKPFRDITKSYGFDELFSPFTTNVSYPIAALNAGYEVIVKNKEHNNNYAPIPSDTKEEILIKLEIADLENIIRLSISSLELALEFIENNSLAEKITRMDYVSYLIGFFAYSDYKKLDDMPEKIKLELVDWVNNIDFSNQSNTNRRRIYTELLKKLI